MKEFPDLSPAEVAFRAALAEHYRKQWGSKYARWAELARKNWTAERLSAITEAGTGPRSPVSSGPRKGARTGAATQGAKQ